MTAIPWALPDDRCFDPNPAQRTVARALYKATWHLPIVSPHGHVDATLFADPQASFGSPADLLIIPDHYVYRLLYSSGIPLEDLGVRGPASDCVESDHRMIWQRFADHFHLFRGTPTGLWLSHVLIEVLGVTQKPCSPNAQELYDQIADRLARAECAPRALFRRFNIEVLCTTDSATSSLTAHTAARSSGWTGDLRPTFRPDDVLDILGPGWINAVCELGDLTHTSIRSYADFVHALERRRDDFRAQGATSTDQSALEPYTVDLGATGAQAVFERALAGTATAEDARLFTAHMIMECARMSVEDGLVMQLHVGSLRNYDSYMAARFGRDRGFDIPCATEFTRNMRALLNRFGRDPRLTLILFTLDESTYTRELAPLAGVYPAVKLGPPWWFHDSVQGMARYRDRVMETAGLHNTVGFNDDTRAFLSIPARHDLARRVDANWLAGMVVRGLIDEQDAADMALDLAYRLAKQTYRLDQPNPRETASQRGEGSLDARATTHYTSPKEQGDGP